MRTPFRVSVWLMSVALTASGCASPVGGARRPADHSIHFADPASRRLLDLVRLRELGEFEQALSEARTLLDQPAGDALLRARVLHEMALTYAARAEYAEGAAADRAAALTHAREALASLEGVTGERPAGVVSDVGNSLGILCRGAGEFDEAIAVHEKLLRELPRAGIERARTLNELGNAFLQRGGRRGAQPASGTSYLEDGQAARRAQEQALVLLEPPKGRVPLLGGAIHNSLGEIERRQARLDAAVEQFTAAERCFREAGSPREQAVASQNLMLSLIDAGRLDEVKARCREMRDLPRTGGDARAQSLLGLAELALGNYDEAAHAFDVARSLTQDPALTIELQINTAACAQEAGKYDEAERYLNDAWRELQGPGADRRTGAIIQANLGRMHVTLGRLDDAERELREALQAEVEAEGPDHPDVSSTRLDLAVLARERAHYADADRLCEEAIAGLTGALGAQHPLVGRARIVRASVLNEWGRAGEAVAQAAAALELLDAALGREHKEAVDACMRAALFAAAVRELEDGAVRFRTLADDAQRRFGRMRRSLGGENLEVMKSAVLLADLNSLTPANFASALQLYEEAERAFVRRLGDGHLEVAELRWREGKLLAEMHQPERASATFNGAISALGPELARHPIRAALLEGLGDVCTRAGDSSRARQLYQQAAALLVAVYTSDHPRVTAFRARHGS